MCSIINFNKNINILNLNYIYSKIKKDKILIKINITNDDTDNLEKNYDFSEITIINLPFDFEDILKKIIENINIINKHIIILCKSTNEEQLKTKIHDFFTINKNTNYKIMILHLTFTDNYIPNFDNIIVKNLITKPTNNTKVIGKVDTVTKVEYKKKTYIANNTYIRTISKSVLYMFFVNYFKLCGFGKLIQISGTCWINGVINSFFLNTSIQKILYKKWNQTLTNDPTYIDEIKQMSFDACPLNIKNMVFKLIYQLIIKKEKLSIDKNIFMDFSDELYKIEELKKGSTMWKGYLQGGDPYILLKHLINNIFYDNECKLIPDKYYNDISKNLIIDISHNYDMLIYYNYDNIIVKEITTKYENKNIKYKLIGGICHTVYYNKIDNSELAGHIMACFMCNNKEYMYDSNGILIRINWIKNDLSFYDKIIYNIYATMYCKNTRLISLYYINEQYL